MPDSIFKPSHTPTNKAMTFSLILLQGPDTQTPFTAFQVAQSIINQNHALEQVFLFHEAAYLAHKFRHNFHHDFHHSPEGKFNIQQQWQRLAEQHSIALNVCISAGIKRGIYNQMEAERYNIPTATIADGFNLVGLGELAEIINGSDEVITLGRFQP